MPPTTTGHKSTIETPITNESTPTPQVPNPTMELAIKDFPSLPNQNQEKHTTKPILEDGEFSDDSMDQSPAVVRKQPIQTNFKRPRENTSDSQEPSS